MFITDDHENDGEDRFEALGLKAKYKEQLLLYNEAKNKNIENINDENEDDDEDKGEHEEENDISDHGDDNENPNDEKNNSADENTKDKKRSKKKRNLNDPATMMKILVKNQQRNKKAVKHNQNKVKEKSKLTRNLL